MPADSVASLGTPEILIESEASGSAVTFSTSAELMLSAMAVSSLPLASATLSVGASATGVVTVTVRVLVVSAVALPSVVVASTVSVKLLVLEPGVTRSPAS